VLSSDLPASTPDLTLDLDILVAMALVAAMLAHHPAAEPLRNPDQSAKGLNSPAGTHRAQKIHSANSKNIAFQARPQPEAF